MDNWKLASPECWRTDLLLSFYWFYQDIQLAESRALTDRFASGFLLIWFKKSKLGSPEWWWTDLLLSFYWFDYGNDIGKAEGLTDRFAHERALVLLRKWYWRDPGSDGQICSWGSVYFFQHFNPQHPERWRTRLLSSFMRLMKKWSWGAQSADWTVCYCVSIENMYKFKLQSPDCWWQICSRVSIEFINTFNLESLECWRTDGLLSFYWFDHENDIGEAEALMGRFANERVLTSLRKWIWREPGLDWQICHWGFVYFSSISIRSLQSVDGHSCCGVSIQSVEKFKLESLDCWRTVLLALRPQRTYTSCQHAMEPFSKSWPMLRQSVGKVGFCNSQCWKKVQKVTLVLFETLRKS